MEALEVDDQDWREAVDREALGALATPTAAGADGSVVSVEHLFCRESSQAVFKLAPQCCGGGGGPRVVLLQLGRAREMCERRMNSKLG